MKVTQKTQGWGNSTGIRLPKKVLQATKWRANQEVTIDIRGRSVILTPIDKPDDDLPTLEELLKGVTPENVHDLIDWGPDVGREIIDDY